MIKVNVVELCKEAQEYYLRVRNIEGADRQGLVIQEIKDLNSPDFQMWLKYFLELECTDKCLESVLAHLPEGSAKEHKVNVAKDLGVSIATVDKRMRESYRVVNFCSNYLQDVKFTDFEERIKNKMYDRIYMKELLVVVENNTARGSYVNALARAGVVTLEDLLSKSHNYLLRADRISERLLVTLTERLQSLGITDFNYTLKE